MTYVDPSVDKRQVANRLGPEQNIWVKVDHRARELREDRGMTLN